MARSFFPVSTNPAWWEHEFGEDENIPTRRRYRANEQRPTHRPTEQRRRQRQGARPGRKSR